MDELERMKYMNEEHYAWRRVVAEFRALGININDEKYTPLVKQVENWGEKLHILRATQPDSLTQQVTSEKEQVADDTLTQEAKEDLHA